MKMTSYDKQAMNVSKPKTKQPGRPRNPNGVTALAEKYGLKRGTVSNRIARGMTPEEAVKKPLMSDYEKGVAHKAKMKGGAINQSTKPTNSQISHYPGRVVSYNTAYQRMKRDPEMSLHDACTTPSPKRRKSPLPNYDPKFTIREQFPEGYVNDLLSPHISDREMMQKWVRSNVTLCHHRSILREEDRRRAVNPTRTPTSKETRLQ